MGLGMLHAFGQLLVQTINSFQEQVERMNETLQQRRKFRVIPSLKLFHKVLLGLDTPQQTFY